MIYFHLQSHKLMTGLQFLVTIKRTCKCIFALFLQRREKRDHIDAITLKLLDLTPKKQRLDVSYLLDKKRQQKKPHVLDV